MSDVNPFEPWRPKDASGSGRDEEIFPWRAAPRQEPAPDDREVPYYERRGGGVGDETPPVPPPSGANKFLGFLALALVVVCLIMMSSNGDGHAVRVMGAACCIWVGAMIGLSLLHQRGWRLRLGVVMAGTVAGVACWMFAPTSGGMNWWQAQAALADLRKLPVGDIAAFRAQQPAREALVRQFPGHRQEMERLVTNWVRETGLQVQREIRGGIPDPRKTLARLEEVETGLAGSSHLIKGLLATCWERAVAARIAQIEKETLALAEKGQFIHAHEVAKAAGAALRKQVVGRTGTGNLDERIREVRGKVFNLHLERAKARLEALEARGDHEEIGREGRRLQIDLMESAEWLNRQAKVNAVLTPFRTMALDTRIVRAKLALEAVLEKEGPEKVPAAAIRAANALDDEARLLGKRGDVRIILRPVRRKAFDVRLARTAEALRASLKKKDYEAVQMLGRASMASLTEEAREVDAQGLPEQTLKPLRRTALLARLDQARERFRALLVKDDYAGIEVLADKTARSLGEEARQLSERKPLDAFTGRCRAFVKLAAAAGKK